MISCSRDQTIKLWDTNSGYCIQTLREGHSDWIRKVALNTKGTLLASASKDETILVWSMDKVKSAKDLSQQADAIVATLRDHENQIDCIRWAPLESNHIIDQSDYNRSYLNQLSLTDGAGNSDPFAEGVGGGSSNPGDSLRDEEEKEGGTGAGGDAKAT